MKKLTTILCAILCSALAHSQGYGDSTTMQPDGKWIDETLQQCLKQNDQTNNGIMACLADALDAWQKQLTDTYAVLINQLAEPHKSNLKYSQTAWASYKNAQFKFLEQYYGSMQGSENKQLMLSSKLLILKRRFEELYDLSQN